jgi:hypothetical protein
MVCHVHVFLRNARNIELGGNLLHGSNYGRDERVDRYDSHPGAIRRLFELHTTPKSVNWFAGRRRRK